MNNPNPISSAGVATEFLQALLDAQASTAEYGNPVQFDLRQESNVTRDSYNSIIARPGKSFTLQINAATILYQPTTKQLEKIGLRTDCDVMIKSAVQDWMDAGIAFDDIELIRTSAAILAVSPGEFNGTTYELKDKVRTHSYANGYLYYAFGLKRR